MAEILNQFEKFYLNSWDTIINVWMKNCMHLNRLIYFHMGNDKYKGIFKGLSNNGHAKILIDGKNTILICPCPYLWENPEPCTNSKCSSLSNFKTNPLSLDFH